jgi:N-acylneuraminate cytidylyltransferase
MSHDTVAIVPARGGSKRIPRKNIRPFLGEPILGRVLGQVRGADCFDEVMVSTDDREIAGVATSHGAAVPFMRSAANSNDSATTEDVVLEVLAAYARAGRHFARVCVIYPTAVFVTPQLLHQGRDLLQSSGADSVVTVLRFSYPIQRAFQIEGGKLRMREPQHIGTRSQDLAPAFHDAGQFYWLRSASFLEQRQIYAPHAVPLLLDDMQAQDIDTEEDWRLAEFKYSWQQQQRQAR